jgi:hypothetical protein
MDVMKPADELAAFRRGWRAACAAIAGRVRRGEYFPFAPPGEAGQVAVAIEDTPPPKTLTVVDEKGGRLL